MHTLTTYVIAVAVVWSVILVVARLIASESTFNTLAIVCGGFCIGMVAMYIAQHVYPFTPW